MGELFKQLINDYWFWSYVGLIIGSIFIVRNLLAIEIKFPVAITLLTVSLYGSMFGIKILAVLIDNPRLFIDDFWSAIAFWHGDLSWQGAVPGMLIPAFIAIKLFKKDFWLTVGAGASGVALIHAFGKIGCLVYGCCYGRACDLPWAITTDLHGIVHPTPIYDGIAEIINFIILQWLFIRRPGVRRYLMPLYAVNFSLHRFFLDFLRGEAPGPELIAGLRIYQVICILYIAFFGGVMILMQKKRWSRPAAAGVLAATALLFIIFHPRMDMDRARSNLYLVVTRPMFEKKLGAWKAHRESQGYQVETGAWAAVPDTGQINGWIREQVNRYKKPCRFVLIVGDAAHQNKNEPWHMPTFIKQFEMNKSAKPLPIFTDSYYGDINADSAPETPVGRLAVRSVADLELQIQKILAYEKTPRPASWYTINIWEGAIPFTDAMHQVALQFVTKKLPAWLDSFLLTGKTDSVFSAWPAEQANLFRKKIADNAFMTMIASHGEHNRVILGSSQAGDINLTVDDLKGLTATAPRGPLFILACDSGRFNLPANQVSFAEAIAAKSGSPITVYAATGPTNPLTNYFIIKCMMEQAHDPNYGTIGDFYIDVQKRLYVEGGTTIDEMIGRDSFTDLSRALKQTIPEEGHALLKIPGLVQNDVLQYNLLGDPATPLYMPVAFSPAVSAGSKGSIIISGESPEGARSVRADWIDPSIKKDKTIGELSRDERYRLFHAVNRPAHKLGETAISGNTWRLEITIPASIDRSRGFLRVLAAGTGKGYYCIIRPGQLP